MGNWELVKKYFKEYNLVRHQIETYNRFILFDIENIIYNEPHLQVTKPNGEIYILKIFGAHVDFPFYVNDDRCKIPLFPIECRLKEITYESHLYVQIEEKIIHNNEVTKQQIHNRVLLAKIPTMLNSVVCNLGNRCESPDDVGGYFIVHGKERVVVGQMRNAYNQPLCSWKNDDLICEMRSMSDETSHSVLVSIKITPSFNILISIPYIKELLPVGLVLKAIGLFKNYNDYIGNEFILQRYYTKLYMDSLDDLTLSDEINNILDFELFPHLGINSTKLERLHCICLMLRQLFLTHAEILAPGDKDSYSNKRIEFCGYLCADLFKMLYKKFLKTMTTIMEKQHRVELTSLNKQAGITSGLLYSFATGNWGVQRNNYIRNGVCQIPHPKVSTCGMISALRRIIIPSGKEGKNDKIRQLHPTSFFYICPNETPEGQSVGVVLNMAIFCHVSNKVLHLTVKNLIQKFISKIEGHIKIFINGIFIDTCNDYQDFILQLRDLKCQQILPIDVTWYFNIELGMIEILCDGGRLLRPLINLEKLKKYAIGSKSWSECVKLGVIEYLDPNQIENTTIAIDNDALLKYDSFEYLEIEPSAMMGVMAVQIPFSDHTQSPRICYQSSMAKQAIGFIPNSSHKTETVSYTLDYIQKTLCSTKMATISGIDANPNGINALVAIACYTGYNQEDSLIINKSSLDRGLFSISVSRTYMVEEKKNGIGNEECICNPPFDKRKLHYNYEHLDENGIVFLKKFVKKNDVIIGKVVTKTTKKETTIVDDSVHATEDGQVVKIVIKPKKIGNIVKVVISKQKIPEIGDKFCSFTAQKGTCGMIYNQEDMPFTEQGICPDIIINPHCIPSRMTINQIIACVLGKIKCVTNKKFTSDGTPFEKTTNFKKLCDRLQEEGFNRDGTEILYNGFTGERIKAQIFFGPTYYHRLKHLVADKIHARAQGQVTALTRQPNCGRSKNGGLRVGEMEKDSMLVHGISRFIKERMFETSDYNTSFVCTNCGIICSEDICHSCKSDSSNTNMPYAAKLLFQELNAMGIRTKIDVA